MQDHNHKLLDAALPCSVVHVSRVLGGPTTCFLFVISIWATLAEDVTSDDIELTLNYADLQSAVDTEIVDSEPVNLMETLCYKLVSNISQNDVVAALSIRIEKPDAPFPHPGGLAVVEHEWTRD